MALVAGGRDVGVRPTFVTGRGVLVEAYLIGLRGRLLRPGAAARRSCSRLRGEKRFDSVDALVDQMQPRRGDARAKSRTV